MKRETYLNGKLNRFHCALLSRRNVVSGEQHGQNSSIMSARQIGVVRCLEVLYRIILHCL